jgi:hypothetical protein
MAKKSPSNSTSKKPEKKVSAKKSTTKSALKKVVAKKTSRKENTVSKESAPKKASPKRSIAKGAKAALRGGHRPFCTECDWKGDNCLPTIKEARKEGIQLHGDPADHAIDTESC